jgi:hypothetical protein
MRFPSPAVLSWIAAPALLIATEAALAQGRSPIVLNFDGAGTTIVKPFADSSFQVQQLWTSNSVNGIQSFSDGSFAFVNCAPSLRTTTEITLSCSIYDATLGRWGEPPVVTTVGFDFLDGPFANPFNSLFELTGDYLTAFQIDEEAYSFRLRLLDAIRAQPGSFPVLVGQTSPETIQTFLLRNVDLPDGTPEVTNFTIGMQLDDLCVDFDVTPVAPGGALVGTLDARRRNRDGTCGEVLVADRPAAFLPTSGAGRAGTICRYRVVDPGRCAPGPPPFGVGATLCLPCADVCRDFSGAISFVFRNPDFRTSAYIDCLDVSVELTTPQCLHECEDGLPAITILQSPGTSAASAYVPRRAAE